MVLKFIISLKPPSYNCKQYAEYKWCTSKGGYGEGRKPHETWIFEDFAKDGETGIVCPECGCKGDKLLSTVYFEFLLTK